jgi:very-short-patch-repair endonuclease
MKDAQIARARELRRDSTKPEKICWELLRNRSLSGVKFWRQHPIGPYFGDFACISAKLVIEIDGEHHAFQIEQDSRRTAFMERQGWRSCASGQTMCSKALKVFGRQSAPLSQRPSPNLSPGGRGT